MPSNVKDSVVFASPKDEGARSDLANTCVRKLGIKFPALVDDFTNATEIAYTGWPDRIYVIDTAGKVAYKSKPGPFGFHAEELEAELKKLR
jgi:type I thyroxine 5'-deiodinase